MVTSPKVRVFSRHTVSALLGVALVLVPSAAFADPSTITPEQGYDLGDMEHPRPLGMGGAQYATGTSTSAVMSNPANLTSARVYHLEGLAAFSPQARRQSYGAAIVDSATNRLAAGLAGTWSMMDPDGARRTWFDLRMAAAYPIADKLSVGLGLRYLRLEQPVSTGPLGASLVSGGTADSPIVSAFTFDAGITLQPTDGLRIAATGRNLTNPEHGYLPTQVVGAIGYSSTKFAVEGDVFADFTTFGTPKARAMVGGEYFIAERFPIRAGYRYDMGTDAHALSVGLGFVDKKFSVEGGLRQDVVAVHPGTFFGFGLRYFIDSGSQNTAETGDTSGM